MLLGLVLGSYVRKVVVVEQSDCECRRGLDFFGAETLEIVSTRRDGRIASADPLILPALVKLALHSSLCRVRTRILLRIQPARIFDRNADQPSWCH